MKPSSQALAMQEPDATSATFVVISQLWLGCSFFRFDCLLILCHAISLLEMVN